MFSKLKFRYIFTIGGTLIALLTLFGTAPGANIITLPFGSDVLAKLSGLPAAAFGVALIYLGTRALLDYLDLEKITAKACEDPQGAGLVTIAVAITRIAVALSVMGMVSIFA